MCDRGMSETAFNVSTAFVEKVSETAKSTFSAQSSPTQLRTLARLSLSRLVLGSRNRRLCYGLHTGLTTAGKSVQGQMSEKAPRGLTRHGASPFESIVDNWAVLNSSLLFHGGGKRICQRRQNVFYVAHNAVVGHFENRRLCILVDRDNDFAPAHAREMLNGS